MPFQQLCASGLLADHIHSFWFTERLFTEADPYFDIMPDGFVEMIFFYNATCSHQKTDRTNIQLCSPFIVGLLDKPVRLKITGTIRVIGIRGYPWMLFRLLNWVPQTNEQLQFQSDHFTHLSEQLKQILTNCSPSDAIDALRRYCEHLLTRVCRPEQSLHSIGLVILQQRGSTRISELAMRNHMAIKTLERKFKKLTGNTAKSFAQKVRFENVRNYIWFNPGSRLSGLAYEFGFTDQAHLHREFKFFSGISPKQFAKTAILTQKGLLENVEIIQV